MPRTASALQRLGRAALCATGAHRMLGARWRGLGGIFRVQRVANIPAPGASFAPNQATLTTPELLDAAITRVRQLGYEIVGLDEMVQRLRAGGPGPFVAFTVDMGFADTVERALPIFERHAAPFAVYVTSDMPDDAADLWWLTLEAAIARLDRVEMTVAGTPIRHLAETTREKYGAWDAAMRVLRLVPPDVTRQAVGELAATAGVDGRAIARRLALTWADLRTLARHPLCTIGVQTAAHYALARLPSERAREDIMAGAARVETELGVRPQHLAYPYGDAASAGAREFKLATGLRFASAVTARTGLLFAEHGNYLRQLPRLPLSGDLPALNHVDICLGGTALALATRFRRVDKG